MYATITLCVDGQHFAASFAIGELYHQEIQVIKKHIGLENKRFESYMVQNGKNYNILPGFVVSRDMDIIIYVQERKSIIGRFHILEAVLEEDESI